MTPEDARMEARREFGHRASLQEEARDARGARGLESIAAGVRFGLRHFPRKPFSALTMIVVLALGIGFNTALFVFLYSFVNGPPSGVERHESLVRIRGIDRALAGSDDRTWFLVSGYRVRRSAGSVQCCWRRGRLRMWFWMWVGMVCS